MGLPSRRCLLLVQLVLGLFLRRLVPKDQCLRSVLVEDCLVEGCSVEVAVVVLSVFVCWPSCFWLTVVAKAIVLVLHGVGQVMLLEGKLWVCQGHMSADEGGGSRRTGVVDLFVGVVERRCGVKSGGGLGMMRTSERDGV